MTSKLRHTSPPCLLAIAMLSAAVLLFVLQYDNGPCKNCNRRLQQDGLLAATASPSTQIPIHILVLQSNGSDSDSGEDSPSNDNDESLVNWSISDSQPQLYGAANTDDRARRIGIVALSLASAFAAVMMVVVAFAWARYHRSRGPDELDQEPGSVADPMSHDLDRKFGTDGGGNVSILRNGDASIADHNPGRRVRFQLPGSSSSVDEGVVAAAEHEEPPHDEPFEEEPKTKKVKISVQDEIHPLEERRPDSVSSSTTADIEKGLENAIFPPPKVEMKNDQETWVNRIMHPCFSIPSCCPEAWYSSGNDIRPNSVAESIQDHSTVASNSFESSTSSKAVSSVTPLFPTPFPTSTYDSPYEADEDEEATAASCPTNDEETDLETAGVLGILDRSEVRNDDEDFIMLEEIHDNHPNKGQRDSLGVSYPLPPPRPRARRDGWFEGEKETSPKTKSHSSWRKRAWQTVGDDAENFHANPLEEFDVESCSGMEENTDDRRWRLVEI